MFQYLFRIHKTFHDTLQILKRIHYSIRTTNGWMTSLEVKSQGYELAHVKGHFLFCWGFLGHVADRKCPQGQRIQSGLLSLLSSFVFFFSCICYFAVFLTNVELLII